MTMEKRAVVDPTNTPDTEDVLKKKEPVRGIQAVKALDADFTKKAAAAAAAQNDKIGS